MREIWRDVQGYEGLYQVSDLGRVRNKRRGRLLRPSSSGGYRHVTLSKDNARKDVLVHRLVATSFIPNPQDKPQVNHINGTKTDNRVLNLEWATCSENQRHRHDVLKRNPGGTPRAVLCLETGTTYQTAAEAAKVLHLCRSAITNCCRGKRNHTGGLHFKYEEE